MNRPTESDMFESSPRISRVIGAQNASYMADNAEKKTSDVFKLTTSKQNPSSRFARITSRSCCGMISRTWSLSEESVLRRHKTFWSRCRLLILVRNFTPGVANPQLWQLQVATNLMCTTDHTHGNYSTNRS